MDIMSRLYLRPQAVINHRAKALFATLRHTFILLPLLSVGCSTSMFVVRLLHPSQKNPTCFTVLVLETSYSYITDFLACVDLNNEFMQKLFSEACRQLQYMYYITAGRESTFTPCERKT